MYGGAILFMQKYLSSRTWRHTERCILNAVHPYCSVFAADAWEQFSLIHLFMLGLNVHWKGSSEPTSILDDGPVSLWSFVLEYRHTEDIITFFHPYMKLRIHPHV